MQTVERIVDVAAERYRRKYPSAGVVRTDAEGFVREMVEQFTHTDRFAAERMERIAGGSIYAMPSCDLYIFEHIDGVAGKESVEQRLYGILDWLLENGRQIIITGSAPTAAIRNLAPRIRAQIDGGITFCAE